MFPADGAAATVRADRARPREQELRGQRATKAIPVSYEPKSSDDWQAHLGKAIESLESEAAQSPEADREFTRQARLRMLYLLGNRRDDALRPIPPLDPAMQDFWSSQLYGLATLLDTQLISRSPQRKAEAKQHLGAAVAKLGESCPLVVRNLAFATDIQSYGVYKPFEKYDFVPGQKVLLYAEVENFKSKETAKGFHTAYRSTFQIFDSIRRVAQHEFPANEEYCRNPRRDFFIVYEFCVPTGVYPGKHTLQLTIIDLNSQKIGQNVIEFAVKSTENPQR
jgi:hypothetical protein